MDPLTLEDSPTAYSNAPFAPDDGPAIPAVLAKKDDKMKKRVANFGVLIGFHPWAVHYVRLLLLRVDCNKSGCRSVVLDPAQRDNRARCPRRGYSPPSKSRSKRYPTNLLTAIS